MLQILLRGRIVDFRVSEVRPGGKKTSVLALQVRAWRQGASVEQIYNCTFDAYWTERIEKLDDKTKFLTVRGSDVVATHEPDVQGIIRDHVWIKAEEFFL